jgi:hypothetical protein
MEYAGIRHVLYGLTAALVGGGLAMGAGLWVDSMCAKRVSSVPSVVVEPVGLWQAVSMGSGVYQLNTRTGQAWLVTPSVTLFLGTPDAPVSDPFHVRAGLAGPASQPAFDLGH